MDAIGVRIIGVMSESAPADDHLNSNRIRQMASLRRAAIRTRSYCVIGLGVCVVAIAQLVFETIVGWPRQISWRGVLLAALYLLSIVGLAGFALPALVRLLIRSHREAKQTAIMPAPDRPPDFSTLQDGSQIAKNLESVTAFDPQGIEGPHPDPLPEHRERGKEEPDDSG